MCCGYDLWRRKYGGYICALCLKSRIEKYVVFSIEESSTGYDVNRSLRTVCTVGQDKVEIGRCVLFADQQTIKVLQHDCEYRGAVQICD